MFIKEKIVNKLAESLSNKEFLLPAGIADRICIEKEEKKKGFDSLTGTPLRASTERARWSNDELDKFFAMP